MMHTHITVVYDGIKNSVFEGQVLQPLVQKLATHDALQGVIISFESSAIESALINKINNTHPRLRLIILKKISYVGLPTLWYASRQLTKTLALWTQYTLQARGPIAGYLCMRAAKAQACKQLTIQARGLLAAEYDFAIQNKPWYQKIFHRMRYYQFLSLEKSVYSAKPSIPCMIEAVSTALGEYLVQEFGANKNYLTIAKHDIPPQLTTNELAQWKKETRAALQIADDALVYCYNGSIKPWQCPRATIEYFIEQQENDSRAILLILTQDAGEFGKLLAEYAIDHKQYRICTVPHHAIYRYLAAGDIGILFRDSHIINWTSRPTKVLEYQAAQLRIVHNNTVALIAQNPANTLE